MNKFLSGIMMAVGLLIAATTGLCSLGFAVLSLYEAAFGNGDRQGMLLVWMFILVGLAVAAFGWWMFRRGLALMQER